MALILPLILNDDGILPVTSSLSVVESPISKPLQPFIPSLSQNPISFFVNGLLCGLSGVLLWCLSDSDERLRVIMLFLHRTWVVALAPRCLHALVAEAIVVRGTRAT